MFNLFYDCNHEDDCDCDLGCTHNNGEDFKVTIIDDEDIEHVCDVVAIYPHNDKQYIVLTPEGSIDSEDTADFFIYEYLQNDDLDYNQIINIESDEEYEEAAKAFEELVAESDDINLEFQEN